VNTVILLLLVLNIWRCGMAFGEMWMELARLRAEDLREEGCRSRRARRGSLPVRPAAAVAGRVGCLPAEGSA
jgi:hypothetical protein